MAAATYNFSNPTTMIIPDALDLSGTNPGAPVTTDINVSGIHGRITNVQVTFVDAHHTFVNDLEGTLAGPDAGMFVLNQDDGGRNLNGNYTFDDSAADSLNSVVSVTDIPPGTYRAHDSFSSAFNGHSLVDGIWSLTLQDFFAQDTGSINGGWQLSITVNNAGSNDFNADGTSDLLWRNTSTGSVSEWQMNAGNIDANLNVGKLNGSWHFQDTGDFNFDGMADALWRNDSGQVVVWSLDGATIVGNQSIGSLSSDWHNQGVGDFNADGNSDVLWRNDSGQVALWTMDGTTIVGNEQVGLISKGFHIQGLLDANADGNSDVLLRHDNGQVVLWTMDGANIVGNEEVTHNLGRDWHVAGTGDFGGDGKDDILLRNDNGQVVLWTMDGAKIVGNQTVGILDLHFHIEDLGDYNNDGKTDVLLRHDNGQVVMWDMDGATITSNHAVLTGSQPSSIAQDWVAQTHHFDIV